MISSFFKDFVKNFNHGDWLGVFIQTILIVGCVIVLVMLGILLYEIAKKVFTMTTYSTEKTAAVFITKKEYQKPYTSTTMMTVYVNNSTMLIPQTMSHPEEFNVFVKFPDGKVTEFDHSTLFSFVEANSHYTLTYQEKFITWILSSTPKLDGLKLLKIKSSEKEISF